MGRHTPSATNGEEKQPQPSKDSARLFPIRTFRSSNPGHDIQPPAAPFTAYYLHNNLGYCLNLKGQYEDAERLCRLAIRVDPSRPNAHKNQGISLAALGQLRAAADAWIAATRANAADDRALGLLESMLADRPELLETYPELSAQIADCKKAVAFARDVMSDG